MNWFKNCWKRLTEPTPVQSADAVSNFTPAAQQVLALAGREAERLNHNFIGTEHVLLGLIKLGQGTAFNVLTKLGLNLENVRLEVVKQMGTGPDQVTTGNIPYTPRVKKALALAQQEAKSLNHTYIGTEHILLGLLCQGKGMTANVLRSFGIDVVHTRNEILRELDPNFSASGSEESPPNSVAKSQAEPPPVESKLTKLGSLGAASPGETSGFAQTELASNFSPRAQQVLALARREAGRLNHNFAGTEHVLLGLIKLGQGTAFNVLAKLGLDLDTVRLEVEKQVGTGPDQKMIGNAPYTPRVKKVIALAQKEAKQLNHPGVGTGHLLLGLLREGDGVAAKVLRSLGVTIERARTEISCEPDFKVALENSGGPSPSGMSNFTPRAQQAMKLAREEAHNLNHGVVGPEHLLLGLIKLGQGVAVNVLAKMRLNLENVRASIEKSLPPGPDPKSNENLAYSRQLQEVLRLANKERHELNHTYLGTEHLLLGILAVEDGVVAKVLKDLGVDVVQTWNEIMSELNPNFSADRPGGGKRYDVYCTERSTEIVVYRNVLFKDIKRLLNSSQPDPMGRFIELEQADGRTIFVSRSSVIKFCEPGVTPGGETVSPARP